MKAGLVFDLDGVLADSFDCLYRLNAEAMRRAGRHLTPTQYREFFRGNIHQSMRRALPDAERRLVESFKRRYFSRYYRQAKLFPFAAGLVKRLSRDHDLAIVSSTKRRFILDLLRTKRLEKNFAAVLGAGALSKRGEVAAACRRLRRAPQQTVFVTDSVGDLRVGRALGLKTVAVAWGFQPMVDLRAARPTACVRTPAGLVKRLKKLCREQHKR